MAKIRNEELVQLDGEVLPERTVLSTVPMDGGGSANFSPFCSGNQISAGNTSGSVLSGILSPSNVQCGLTNTSDQDVLSILHI